VGLEQVTGERWVSNAAPTGATAEEAEVFLAHHPEVEAIDLVLIDPNGIGRGKIIRRHELASLYRRGRFLPTSILGLDVEGEDVDGTGLVWDVGDADRLAWPIPGTLTPMNWTAPARGQVLVSMFELDGRPMAADPRHAMLRQVDALRARGLRPQGAFELEFFLFESRRGPDGRPQPARARLDDRAPLGTQVYGLEELDGMQPLFADVYRAAKGQGLPLETLISEYAPGQYELTLHYREDFARAADDLVVLKRLVRGVARRHGLAACFMAKPVAGYAGSGMHLHVSAAGPDGTNAFAEPNAGSPGVRLREAIGGLLDTMADAMLVFAPNANSWRRFVSQSYAPIAPTWGVNNRSVAIRVPAGSSAAQRLEHRVAGVDANPYLVATAVLAGVCHGLDRHLDPGPPVVGDGYASGRAKTMPADWRQAIERATASLFLRDALGESLHRSFTVVKASEQLRVASAVGELDYQLYLDLI
jgi:glutamine synthetase